VKLTYKDDGHEYYLNGRRCRGVTTTAKIPDDLYNLQQWDKRMVAIGLSMSPPLVERVAAHYDDKQLLNRICDEAKAVAKAHEAGARGTAAHRITERVDTGLTVIETDMAKAVRESWTEALDHAGLDIVPEYVERIVVYPDWHICGRFDRIARRRSDGQLVVVDLKTGTNVVVYPHAIACQLALYAYAPLLAGPLPPQGGTTSSFEAWPPDDLDLEQGVVIHMPAEGQAQVVDMDIASGWKAVEEIIFPTLEWRARRDLAQVRIPRNIIPPDPLLSEATVSSITFKARLAWIRARVERLIEYGHGDKLAELWSAHMDVPTFKQGGPRNLDDIDVIAHMCDRAEANTGVPFGPSDPATPPATTKKERTTA
jgi:hypothetical protein